MKQITKLLTTTLLLLLLNATPAATGPTALPAKFEADLVRVTPETRDGKTITFYTDSGGGLFLTDAAVKRLGLRTEAQKGQGDQPAMDVVNLPAFKPGAAIPPPLANDGRIFRLLERNSAVLPADTPQMIIKDRGAQELRLHLSVHLQLLIDLRKHQEDQLFAI